LTRKRHLPSHLISERMAGVSAFAATLVGIGEGPAKTQDDVRTSSSGGFTSPKAVRLSRDRGCKGHRILRRVLVGGRHLGLSRTTSFHEAVITATLAASSRGRARARKSPSESEREGAPQSCGRGRGDRGVRGSIAVGAVGRKLPCSDLRLESEETRQGSACPAAVRRSVLGCRETPGPLVCRAEPKTPWGTRAVKAA
jgi:hypothetical protein